VWKCLHDAAPRYLADLCVPANSVHGRQQLRSTASGTLLVPRSWTATGQCSFAINGPRTWNSLPAALRTPDRERGGEGERGESCSSKLCTLCSFERHLCFSSSLRCCWQVDSAPFVRRRCDCSASLAPFTNIHTYLLTYLLGQMEDVCHDVGLNEITFLLYMHTVV